MSHEVAKITLIQDLESRQEDLLKKLEELNRRVEATLAQFSPPRVEPAPAPAARAA
jgi:hypothetical protein